MGDISTGIEALKNSVGKEMGLSDWFEVTQERVDKFGAAIKDRQWIHCDVEKAKAGPFGATIVHGPLLISLIGHLSGGVDTIPDGIKFFMHYGFDKVRFISPVMVGSRIRNRSRMEDFINKGDGKYLMKIMNTIEVEGAHKPACIAESLGLVVT